MGIDDYENVFNKAGVLEDSPLHCNFKDGKVVDICSLRKDYYNYVYGTTHELILHQHKQSGQLVMIARERTGFSKKFGDDKDQTPNPCCA